MPHCIIIYQYYLVNKLRFRNPQSINFHINYLNMILRNFEDPPILLHCLVYFLIIPLNHYLNSNYLFEESLKGETMIHFHYYQL
jgi:hypothetical protein